MKMKFFQILFVLALSVFAQSNLAAAVAHTYHTSLTRIDYDAKEKMVEITIQVFTHDLVPLLEKRMKKRPDLEKSAEAEGEIFKYLNENFIIEDKNGEKQKLQWVGKEIEVDTVYLYLEIPTDYGLQGAKLKNTIFFESFPEQTNLVIAHFDDKKSDLLFKAGDSFKDF